MQILVRTTKERKEEITKIANKMGITVNALMNLILNEWLNKQRG